MEAEPMFICDYCACLMDILEISQENNIVRRNSKCPNCGFNFDFLVDINTNEIMEIIK